MGGRYRKISGKETEPTKLIGGINGAKEKMISPKPKKTKIVSLVP